LVGKLVDGGSMLTLFGLTVTVSNGMSSRATNLALYFC